MKLPKIKLKPYRPTGKIALPRESAVNTAVRIQNEDRKRRKADEQAQANSTANATTVPGVV